MFLPASFMLWSDEIWKNQHHVYVAVPKTWTVVTLSLKSTEQKMKYRIAGDTHLSSLYW